MSIEPLSSIEEVVPFLAECALPVADISPSPLLHFFGVRVGGGLVAVVGIELYPPFALLRSLAVVPAFRGRGLAHELVGYAESFAAAQNVEAVFLLTTTAEGFFLRLGYSPASRSSAPSVIRATSQFSGLCPSSSAFLSKRVAPVRANPAVNPDLAQKAAQGRLP
ncbi:arsenic resistance N-acetyltransferase ArsN2 [Azonexus sp. R2A61]|uniref:arsenic resistance N-acetyltransferase ArsN2 n=1 Tax=Azonexus sp. R2A61 TaxID=2744443 RepID=UPI001F1CA784|nr:arsenic resistance N-acetyltransferase ArsN2 [Azonexus sp. R2A61]